MVGGDAGDVERCMPIFEALKPAGEFGFVHAGRARRRALRQDGPQRHRVRADARLRRGLRAAARLGVSSTNVPGVFKSWREGTVVRSWLLDLLDRALDEDPDLAELRGYADDTGEGRWTVEEAIRLAVPMNVDRRVAVRPVRVPAGRLAGDEGGRRAAQPVRRARGQ